MKKKLYIILSFVFLTFLLTSCFFSKEETSNVEDNNSIVKDQELKNTSSGKIVNTDEVSTWKILEETLTWKLNIDEVKDNSWSLNDNVIEWNSWDLLNTWSMNISTWNLNNSWDDEFLKELIELNWTWVLLENNVNVTNNNSWVLIWTGISSNSWTINN